jgi:hypothetical protein
VDRLVLSQPHAALILVHVLLLIAQHVWNKALNLSRFVAIKPRVR